MKQDVPNPTGPVQTVFGWPVLVLGTLLVIVMLGLWPVFFCLPIFLPAIVVLVIVFRNWKKITPADILFRLGALAACDLVQCWLPIYYWTTYTPSGDERDGG
ncbi:MAG TPA: hypothetical protein VK811_05455, partial [Candidatus Acidoferrum sp.]|nr:hypothetical protein [Candidatus Acidoferrum sp.]